VTKQKPPHTQATSSQLMTKPTPFEERYGGDDIVDYEVTSEEGEVRENADDNEMSTHHTHQSREEWEEEIRRRLEHVNWNDNPRRSSKSGDKKRQPVNHDEGSPQFSPSGEHDERTPTTERRLSKQQLWEERVINEGFDNFHRNNVCDILLTDDQMEVMKRKFIKNAYDDAHEALYEQTPIEVEGRLQLS